MVPAVEEQVNFRNSCSRVQTKSRQGKQDVCPWCAEPAHRNGNTDCRAQAYNVMHPGGWISRASHVSIQFQTGMNELSVPYRGRSYSSKQKQQVRHVDVEEEYDGFQYDNFSIDKTPIQSIHTTKYSQRSKELEERIHTVRITWKRYRQKGSALRIRKGK